MNLRNQRKKHRFSIVLLILKEKIELIEVNSVPIPSGE